MVVYGISHLNHDMHAWFKCEIHATFMYVWPTSDQETLLCYVRTWFSITPKDDTFLPLTCTLIYESLEETPQV